MVHTLKSFSTTPRRIPTWMEQRLRRLARLGLGLETSALLNIWHRECLQTVSNNPISFWIRCHTDRLFSSWLHRRTVDCTYASGETTIELLWFQCNDKQCNDKEPVTFVHHWEVSKHVHNLCSWDWIILTCLHSPGFIQFPMCPQTGLTIEYSFNLIPLICQSSHLPRAPKRLQSRFAWTRPWLMTIRCMLPRLARSPGLLIRWPSTWRLHPHPSLESKRILVWNLLG